MKELAKRFILIFPLLFFLPSNALAQSGNIDSADSNIQNEDTYQEGPWALPVEIIKNPQELELEKKNAEESRSREIEDLEAQKGMNAATQEMNDATQKMAKYALYTLVTSGLGTIILIVTVLLALQANRAAIAAVALERAWLMVDNLDATDLHNCLVDDKLIKHGVMLAFGFRNKGRTPAVDVMSTYRYQFLDEQGNVPEFDAKIEPDAPRHIASPDGLFNHEIILDDEATNRFLERGDKLIVYVLTEYFDVFSKTPRKTEGCFSVVFRGRVDINGKVKMNLGLQPIGRQNRTT